MVLTGIVGGDSKAKTAGLISSIALAKGLDIKIYMMETADISSETFQNLKLDVIVYTGDPGMTPGCMEQVFSLLKPGGALILNGDDSQIEEFLIEEFLKEKKLNVITYGFGSNADVTASSVGDMLFQDQFLCYLQSPIVIKSGAVIEPQEYLIRTDLEDVDSYNILAAASFAIANGINLNSM